MAPESITHLSSDARDGVETPTGALKNDGVNTPIGALKNDGEVSQTSVKCAAENDDVEYGLIIGGEGSMGYF